MKKLFHLFLVTIFICFNASIFGMKRKNDTTLTIRNPKYTSQMQEESWFPQEIIAHIAGYCWGKEKDQLMRACKYFYACVKDRKLMLQTNLLSIDMTDKVEALITYAREGDAKMAKFLLDNGISVNYCNYLGIKPFYDAHKDVMPLLIEYGAQVDEPKATIDPLHEAVYKNDKEMMLKALLKLGVDPNPVLVETNATPLRIASGKGYAEIVELLLAVAGIEINMADNNGATPLCIASQNGHAEIVKLLIDAQADVNKADNSDLTPLMFASRNGYTTIVKLLLKVAGIKVNKADNYGWTALRFASENGHTEIVKLLIDAQADVNKAGNNGCTPLSAASFKGHIEIVRLLLAADGIDVNKATNKGTTPLMIASEKGCTEIIKLLIDAQADVNTADNYGATPLVYASQNGHTKIVKLLLVADNIEVNMVNNNGWTSLQFASQNGHTEVVKLLLTAAGIEVNMVNSDGSTPLMIASYKDRIEIVKLLLTVAGIEVNKVDNDGCTSLCMASYHGSSEIIQLLLDNGANIHAALMADSTTDLLMKAGDTALDIARKKGHVQVVALLEAALRHKATEERLQRMISPRNNLY